MNEYEYDEYEDEKYEEYEEDKEYKEEEYVGGNEYDMDENKFDQSTDFDDFDNFDNMLYVINDSDNNYKEPDYNKLYLPNNYFNFKQTTSSVCFYSKIVGVTHDNRQELIRKLDVGKELQLIREPQNTYDRNAIAVYSDLGQLGYIPKETAISLAESMDLDEKYQCHVSQITGQTYNNLGVNIHIQSKPYDLDSKTTPLQMPSKNKAQPQGCYIATAVYRSYSAPEVLVLRKYRDEVLNKTRFGKFFIKSYYIFSPPIAGLLRYSYRLNVLSKYFLDKLVLKIKKKYGNW